MLRTTFSTASENRGRLRIGVLAAVLERVSLEQTSASMLSASTVARNIGAQVQMVDPYWTLVMYYNSLRELVEYDSLQQNVPRWMLQYR